jgi:hypothetical protein
MPYLWYPWSAELDGVIRIRQYVLNLVLLFFNAFVMKISHLFNIGHALKCFGTTVSRGRNPDFSRGLEVHIGTWALLSSLNTPLFY